MDLEKANLPPTVSVVIPCRNEREHISGCLLSIFEQTDIPGEFEVIVADGMSDDGTREILAGLAVDHPQLRVIDNRQRTVSTGLNAAIRLAKGDIIIRMDAHSEYAPDYIRECLSVLQETGADNVGGPARTKSKNYIQEAICAGYHSPFAVGGARFHDVSYEGPVDTVTYGCWRRATFDRIGLFDVEMLNTEDDELNFRLRRSGGTVWQSPRIKSWYYPRDSLGKLFRQYMNYGYWKVRVIQKHKVPASLRHLVPALFLSTLVVLALTSLWFPLAGYAWVIFAATYLICTVAASIIVAAQTSWKLLSVLPLIFVCYHVSYGYGFLRGLFDFLILKRGSTLSYHKLSRS